jgi:hypothetical protein
MSTLLIADEQDDVFTIRARLTASRNETFALVIPPENEALGREVTMRLLHRYAEGLGVPVAVISESPPVRRAATAAGFDAFGTVDEFEAEQAAGSRDRGAESGTLRLVSAVVSWLLLVGLLVGLAAAGYVLVPTATVTLTPRTETVSGIAEIAIDSAPGALAADSAVAHGRPVEMQIEVEERAPTTGFGGKETKATGAVILANRSAQPLTVPKGTIVSTSRGVRFQTDGEVVLAGGVGRVAAVPVSAVQAGEAGSVASRQIGEVEGLLRPLVSVTNDEPTSGGSQISSMPTDRDQESLLASALERARAESAAALRKMLTGRDVLVNDTVRVRVVESSFDRQPGEPAAEVAVRLVARATALIVDGTELDRAARGVWTPPPRAGYDPVPDSARVRSLESAVQTGRGAVAQVRVESIIVARIDETRAVAAARWRTAREAEAELARGFELARRPVVAFDQPWAQRAYRVEIQVAPTR